MLDSAFVNALPAIHAISGCDTSSRLYKTGKKSAVLAVKQDAFVSGSTSACIRWSFHCPANVR